MTKMIRAADENNVKLQIGFMRRFDESFQEAKRMIAEGEIGGDCLGVKISFQRA